MNQSDHLALEIGSDEWWRAGANFRWCWPKFNVYVPADTKPRALLNRYPHNVIGAGVVIFGRAWGVQWKHTPRRKPATHSHHLGSP